MLCRSRHLLRSASVLNKTLESKIHISTKQWLGNLFSSPIPKGFGKFYPPSSGGGASAGKAAGTSQTTLINLNKGTTYISSLHE